MFRALMGTLTDIYVGMVAFVVIYKDKIDRLDARVAYLLQLYAPIPLVEGRSSFSELSCDAIVHELQKKQALLEHGVDNSMLKMLMTIGENCQRRRAYERYLRQEQGLASDEVVMIPSPGVPRDFPIGDDHDDHHSFQNTANEFQSNVEMQDWAKSFTDDQEVSGAQAKHDNK